MVLCLLAGVFSSLSNFATDFLVHNHESNTLGLSIAMCEDVYRKQNIEKVMKHSPSYLQS